MEELFKKLGRKSGEVFNRGRWFWKSTFSDDDEAIKSEYILGRNLTSDLLQKITIDSNPELNELLVTVGKNLEDPLKNKQRKFHYYIHYTEDVNAYALPGGFIFITYGLINQIKNEPDELAFVLAHEMMHVVLGHPIQRVFTNYGTKLLHVVLSRYTKMGTISKQVINQLMTSNYSRENEFEADAGGLALMKAAGYIADKSTDLLAKLDTSKQNGIYNYFASHPPIKDRILKLNKRNV